MKHRLRRLLLIAFLLYQATAALAQSTIYTAARIYTADTLFRTVESMVVENGRIVYTGALDSSKKYFPESRVINYKKKFIYPGFIDAHCHFAAWCRGLKECDLTGTKSEKEVISRVKKFAAKSKRTWIVGRGWDQNDWKDKKFPGIAQLDAAFPDRPVCLKRIDGHAAWINSAAARAIGLDTSQSVDGGEILMENGNFTGILIDNAVDLVTPFIPDLPRQEMNAAIAEGAARLYAQGLTTVDEAGLHIREIRYLDSLQNAGLLSLRIYAMLSASPESFAWIAEHGITNNGQMHVGAVKFYLDGALGSRGALLKKDYCDRLGHKGLLLQNVQEFGQYCSFLGNKGWQVCVHAIGDSANALALRTFGKYQPAGMDNRWRIEHAQIVDPRDFGLFKKYGVIPSVQPTHATSDGPWATDRLCEARLPGAYNYAELCRQAGLVALGTDFPVEDISTVKTFYSATQRTDVQGTLKTPFNPQGALTRKQALLGMTIWAAMSNKEENDKGSLEAGKFADFVVMDTDLMEAEPAKLKKARVKSTFIGGKKVFGK